jgi:hypothetical protein
MRYETLEDLEEISAELYRAIEIEQEISDLLFDGYSCNSPEVQRCNFDKWEIVEAIENDSFNTLVVSAVGKELWRQRVHSARVAQMHPEYSRDMYKQVTDCFWMLADSLDDQQMDVACFVLDHIDLPRAAQTEKLPAIPVALVA